jgi:hypothetical protein
MGRYLLLGNICLKRGLPLDPSLLKHLKALLAKDVGITQSGMLKLDGVERKWGLMSSSRRFHRQGQSYYPAL